MIVPTPSAKIGSPTRLMIVFATPSPVPNSPQNVLTKIKTIGMIIGRIDAVNDGRFFSPTSFSTSSMDLIYSFLNSFLSYPCPFSFGI